MMHVHVSTLDALTIFAMWILVATAWRVVSSNLAERDHPLGKAMDVVL